LLTRFKGVDAFEELDFLVVEAAPSALFVAFLVGGRRSDRSHEPTPSETTTAQHTRDQERRSSASRREHQEVKRSHKTVGREEEKRGGDEGREDDEPSTLGSSNWVLI
jgi:hypothetical protein